MSVGSGRNLEHVWKELGCVGDRHMVTESAFLVEILDGLLFAVSTSGVDSCHLSLYLLDFEIVCGTRQVTYFLVFRLVCW